jgi:two-component system sensor kinase FixL
LVKKQMAELYVDRRPTLSFEFIPEDPLPDVRGDKELLDFVIRTLIQNALEAIPNEAGRVAITIRNRSDQGRVEFTIRDTGEGIPDHLVPRLFQPFLTTKTGRQGLSLSRAKRFVELQGGTLSLIETSPQGTTFQMNLRVAGGR